MPWSEPGFFCWLALHFVLALTGTWLARRYALRRGLIDQPGVRRSHATATPRGGGIAIVAAALFALGWLALAGAAGAGAAGTSGSTRNALYVAIAIGLLLVAGIGWLDDHRPLSAWLRLGMHAAAAAILAWGIHRIGGNAVATSSTFVLALVLVNIWNFMDGIDGLATSQAGLVALGYALLGTAVSGSALLAGQMPMTWLALAVAAACAGFLPFNLPRARIFLGDVGSGALGFLLAALVGLLLSADAKALPLALLPLSAFAIDAALTLAVRIVRQERWWLPHTQHAYQRWSRSSGRHGPVTLAYALWTTATVLLMLGLSGRPPAVIMAALGATCLAGGVGWWCLQGMAKTSGSAAGNE